MLYEVSLRFRVATWTIVVIEMVAYIRHGQEGVARRALAIERPRRSSQHRGVRQDGTGTRQVYDPDSGPPRPRRTFHALVI